MSTTTATTFAHTVARMAGCDVSHLIGLTTGELAVLYYGMLSDDVTASFRGIVDHLDTAALELYALRPNLTGPERAYCRLLLARRAVRAGIH